MGLFDAGAVSWPSGPAGSKSTNYKRRAYGTITANGNSKFKGCAGSKTLSFQSLADPATKRGGRYAPAPHLTSISTKNHGGGDMSEAALWEIEFAYTIYDKDDLDDFATSFMIPGALVNVKLGWNTGGSFSVSGAEIFDFSWSYSVENGSWNCTGKALGSNVGSAGGLIIKTTGSPSEVTDEGSGVRKGYSLFNDLDITAQESLGVKRDKDGNLAGPGIPSGDGSAKAVGNFGIINAFVESGWFSDTSNYQTMVKFSYVLSLINERINAMSGVKFEFESGKYHALADMVAADPLRVCLPSNGAAYAPSVAENKNNFSGLTGAVGEINDIWVSTQLLKEIEESLLNKGSDKDKKSEYTANSFLSKLFGEISNMTGGLVNCTLVSDPYDKTKYKIVNKMYDVKYGAGTALALRGTDTPVKSVNMSSNMDPDMMAIALAGRNGKYPSNMADNIFAGCSKQTDGDPGESAIDKVKALKETLGNKYDASATADFPKVLKEYVNDSLGGKGIMIRYNIDLSVTVDGFNPKFGQGFSVSPIPASVGSGNISFIVGEIEHKCDGATWDTTVVGYMHVKT